MLRMKKYLKGLYSYIKKRLVRHGQRNILMFILACGTLFIGIMLIWVSTFQIPSLNTLEERKGSQSTKIYDNAGKILLYDVYQNTKRTVVPLDKISDYVKDATLSIEDKDFYNHIGVKPLSIARAMIVNLLSLSYSQGGSTITQQVVKNTILTGDKTPTRKL